MKNDAQIYIDAMNFVATHGKDAKIQAAFTALKNLDSTDSDDFSHWYRVLRAIDNIHDLGKTSCFH